MKKKKILMVHNFYQIGGGEHTVFKNEVDMLRKYNHEVIEYTRNNNELKSSKLKLLLLPLSTIWSWKTYFEVKKIIRKENIDVVHCHNTFPLISPSVYYAARHMNIPVVQTIHNFRFLCPNGTFFCEGKICDKCNKNRNFVEALKNKCYRNSRIQTLVLVLMLKIHRCIGTYNKISYIFLTDFNKSKFQGLIDINSDQVFVKPNFVNEHKFVRNNVENKYVFASRLEANKGLDKIIKYWKNLPKDYILHIYGEGPLKQFVEDNATENIIYEGFKQQSEIFEDMLTATAMIFPSVLFEGFPMIVAESISIGCPVISSNIGNEADIVLSSKAGVTFDVYDEKSFVKAIEEIKNKNEEYSSNAQKYYYEVLSEEKNYRKLVDIYDKARVIK